MNEENVNDSGVNNTNAVEPEQAKVPKRRGRKPGAAKIAFPADREFTAPEIVDQLGVKPYIVSNELNKALKEQRVTVVGSVASNKGRGRHCKVYKAVV